MPAAAAPTPRPPVPAAPVRGGRPTPWPQLALFAPPPDPPVGAAGGRVLVSLATYNEADNLGELVAAILARLPAAHVLVVDDNSPDGTGRLADRLAAADRRVRVVHRPRKLGLGTAILAAMRYAIDHRYDLLVNMDADFSHPPRFLPGLLAGAGRYDVVIGSRYVAGGGTENWPAARRAISRAVNTLVRVLFRMPVADASGAFRCYRVATLAAAQVHRSQSRGYSFQQEVLFRCHRTGATLGEHPIVFENRRAGKSKVNWQEAGRSLGTILWIGVHHFFGLRQYGPARRPRAARRHR